MRVICAVSRLSKKIDDEKNEKREGKKARLSAVKKEYIFLFTKNASHHGMNREEKRAQNNNVKKKRKE